MERSEPSPPNSTVAGRSVRRAALLTPRSGLLVIAVGAASLGCDSSSSTPARSSASASSPNDSPPSARPLQATSAPSETASPSGRAAASKGHCKASGTADSATLSTRPYLVVSWFQDAKELFALAWLDKSLRGELARVDKQGGAQELVALDGPGAPGAVVADGTHLFYSKGRKLFRVPKAGGAPEPLADEFGDALALHGEHIYGCVKDPIRRTGKVSRLPKSGGEPTTLATRPAGSSHWDAPYAFQDLAVDESGVYVSDAGTGTLFRIALEGGALTPVAEKQRWPLHVALTDSDVWWTTAEPLRRQAKGGGKLTDVDTPVSHLSNIAVFGDRLYYVKAVYSDDAQSPVTSNRIITVPASGGTPSAVRTLPANIRQLAADKECLYAAIVRHGETTTSIVAVPRTVAKEQ